MEIVINHRKGAVVMYFSFSAAWLKMKLNQLGLSTLKSSLVEKLTGDNSKEEKERVIDLFKSGCVWMFL